MRISGVFLGLPLFLISSMANAHINDLMEGAAGIQDRVNRFVNSDRAYRSLLDYQSTVGFSGRSAFQPWSSTFWPLDQGMAAYGYADRRSSSHNFSANERRFKSRIEDFQHRLQKKKLSYDDFNLMSPAEKYDIYLGDATFTFSRAIWMSLNEHEAHAKKKKIQDWEGICHGWSPAAIYTKRPLKQFTVQSLDGRFSIPFYPDDIKALSSVMWANSLVQDQTIIEGIRCDTNVPAQDYGSGKVLRTRCKGVNPGVWHLSVLGLIGEKHMAFVMNKNNDIEIWNQPTSSYDFKYYNPKTNETGNVENVAVPIGAFNDKFSKFRDPNTAYVVGVDMNFKYIDETEPYHAPTDDPSKDLVTDMHMKYELELDAGYQVLGGEWVPTDDQLRYIPNYPAFMWRFPSDFPQAFSIADANLFDDYRQSPSATRALSAQASWFRYQRYMINEDGDTDVLELDENGKPIPAGLELRPQPLGKVVYDLIEMAQ